METAGDKMISEIANKITICLEKNKLISKKDTDVYNYGFEIMISTIITFAIVIILGIVMKSLSAALIYFGIFALLRQICGGYHAESYLKCNIIFTFTTFIVIAANKYVSVDICGVLHYLITAFWILSVFAFAPIENKNKQLSKSSRKVFKALSRVICVLMSLITCLTYIKKFQCTVLLDATIFFVALAMVISGFRMKGCE
ncbi:MAG: accessory gene regulator B family protein [Alistipes sp.]|nr:accessory gene regulator B family protein [Alistipes sp.]